MEYIQNIAWIGFFTAASALDGEYWEIPLILCGIFLIAAIGIEATKEQHKRGKNNDKRRK